MSENKKSFPPPVPKRKPEGFRSKSGEGSSMQRMSSMYIASDRPETNPYRRAENPSSPSRDQTTVKPPPSGPLNPLRSFLYPQQPRLTPSKPHPINQDPSSLFTINQGPKLSRLPIKVLERERRPQMLHYCWELICRQTGSQPTFLQASLGGLIPIRISRSYQIS
jgi:hypothetical protein